MKYAQKDEAINNLKDGEFLFQELYTSKRFLCLTQDDAAKQCINNNGLCEHYGYNDAPIKMFFDLDYDTTKNEGFYNMKIENTMQLLKMWIEELNEYLFEVLKTYATNIDQTNANIIILTSSTETKFSYHIIYENIIFSNIKQLKRFAEKIKVIATDRYSNILDMSVYGRRALRLINQSKMNEGKQNLKQVLWAVNGNNLIDDDEIINKFKTNTSLIKSTFLSHIKNDMYIIDDDWTEIDNNNDVKDDFTPDDELVVELLKLLKTFRSDKYEFWHVVKLALKSTGDDRFLNEFINFSKRSKNAAREQDIINFWNTTQKTTGNIYTLATIFKWAKIDNLVKYNDIVKKYDFSNNINFEEEKGIIIEDTLTISKEFLLNDENNFTDCDVSQYMNKFIQSYHRNLIIKSPYHTGKTSLLEVLTKMNDYKRILFITYRITLNYALLGSFGDSGFVSYKDNNHFYLSDRVICQVDSIIHIPHEFCNYDMVIIDESESCLQHFSSPFMKNTSHRIFNKIMAIMTTTKKNLFLDGDISNRTIKFAEYNGPCMMINNTIQKNTKNFNISNDKTMFDKKIFECVDQKKPICIITTSSEIAELYYEEIKDKVNKCLLYTGNTSGSDKKKLIDVNKEWSDVDVLIYTNTIEAGVSFDIKNYFDTLFIAATCHGASERALRQMMKRIRSIKSNDYYMYCHDTNMSITDKFKVMPYTFTDIDCYYNNINMVNDEGNYTFYTEDGVLCSSLTINSDDMYNTNNIYCKLEELNKHPTLYIPFLCKRLKEQGHTYKFIDKKEEEQKTIICTEDGEEIKKLTVYNIATSRRITQIEYNIIKSQEATMSETKEDKMAAIKFIYERQFGITIEKEEDLKKYINRFNIVDNAKNLIDGSVNISSSDLIEKEAYLKLSKVKELLNIINVNVGLSFKQEITKDQLLSMKGDIIKFASDNATLFGKRKGYKIDESKKGCGGVVAFIKSILDNYAIECYLINEDVKVYDKVTKKRVRCPIYAFNFDENVNNRLIKIYEKEKITTKESKLD